MSSIKFSFILLLYCLFCIYSTLVSARNISCDSLLGKKYAERYASVNDVYESLREKDSLAVMQTLNDLEACAVSNGDKELLYTYRLLRYRIYMRSGMGVPHFDDTITHFLQQIDGKKYNLLRAEALVVLGEYHWLMTKEIGPGFEYQLSAYNIYHSVPAAQFPMKYFALYHFALGYYRFGDHANTNKILHEAIMVPSDHNLPEEFNLYNLMGLCYRKMGMYDSAVLYFQKAHKQADSLGRTVWRAILSGNIGITYYLQKRYEEAIPLLEKDVYTCMMRKEALRNVPKSMTILADAYLQTGRTGKALQLFDSVQVIMRQINFWDEYRTLYIIYPIMGRGYIQAGQREKAYAMFDSALVKQDSFYTINSALIMAGASHKVDAEKHLADILQLKTEQQLERLKKNAWIVGIILTALLIILFINRQKIAHRRKAERAQAEKRQVEAELAGATAMLDSFTRSVQQKNELIEKFGAEIEKLRSLHTGGLPEGYNETLLQLQNATILTDEQWEEFRRMFEKVHEGYLNRLKIKLPGLSPAETRIMTLTKLQLSNKEMAGMLGITPDAVRMSKHRLRKKLDLDGEGGIDELAGMI